MSRDIKKVTTHQLSVMKERGEKIAMLTAYDYTTAKILTTTTILSVIGVMC